ncbi:MAG: thioredoxin [Oscillospiraceae bacterium]|jgi:thioredoxin 1|nr:thioredoxin [Oscillospiraceae bacterium]MBR6208576.1 thioredoxin [Oscillospiraceae bacterium]
MAEITLTSANFEQEVLQSPIPVLVDFWASWCGPCRMVAPLVAQIAEEQAGKVKVGKVNVDEEPELAVQFGINSIPSLLVFRDGKLVNQAVGARPKSAIEAMLG